MVEHNIRVIAKCYSKIRSGRLSALLDKPQDETEEHLSRLVVAKSVRAPAAWPIAAAADAVTSMHRFLLKLTGPTAL